MIKKHYIYLIGEKVKLRPFTEEDLLIVFPWNNDPEVLYYAEGGEIKSRTMQETEEMYGLISNQGLLFIIETMEGIPIGEVCLQYTNKGTTSGSDEKIMRFPMMIGDKKYWGKGYGKDVLNVLAKYAFEKLKTDKLCAIEVSEFNDRMLKLLISLGFKEIKRIKKNVKRGNKFFDSIDLEIKREDYQKQLKNKQ